MEPHASADPNRSLEAQVALRRRSWRRRRRLIGTLAFLAVVVVLGVAVATTLGGDDGGSASGGGGGGIHAARGPTTTAPPTTVPPAGPYRVNDGLHVRAGPGATYPIVGTLELGTMVKVVCVVDGDQVSGTSGTTNKWLRLAQDGSAAYVTAAYVGVGADLTNPQVIPVCPS